MEWIHRLIGGVWLGSAVFLMLSASAVFRAAPNATAAADVVGAMLTRWHYIALAAPLLLFALELRRVRPFILILLFASVILAASQSFVDLRIRAMRITTAVPISSLDPGHPLRRNFGRLHGISMLLLAMQGLAAVIVVAAGPKRQEVTAAPMKVAAAAPVTSVPVAPAVEAAPGVAEMPDETQPDEVLEEDRRT